MRDAFGGAFMIKLMLIFLVIYVCFIAVALNYAKAFKAKNGIIDLIEKYEGFDICKDQIDAYLSKISYNVSAQSGPTASYAADNPGTECQQQGYCIMENLTNDGSGTNYVVTTFVQVSFFGFDNLAGISFTVRISGEVRIPIRSV